MSRNSLATLPEVFVSDGTISKAVYQAVERGEMRKLGSRLYTRNLDEDPERLVRRNWYNLVAAYYPDAIIADRTALEGKPGKRWDGFVEKLIWAVAAATVGFVLAQIGLG